MTRRSVPLLLAALLAGCTPSATTTPSPLSSVASGMPSTTPASPIRFVDVTEQAGLHYQWSIAGERPINILQGIGNGCAFVDYDNDGNLDILLVGPKLALYQGDGHGHFTDKTHDAGLDTLHGNFLGCAVGDYDNDGYEDIYLSAYRGGLLLHNAGGKRFTDVTKVAGIAPQPWGTACAFVDIDSDGRLDLYIGNYVDFGPKTKPQMCDYGGVLTACGPRAYVPRKGVLYHNLGDGRFADVTTRWNATCASGKTLGIATADYDGSGRQSLYLGNDTVPSNLLKNLGTRFVDIGAPSGTGYTGSGQINGIMGVDWGDYDNDGRIDLASAAFQHESQSVYHNQGKGLFTDVAGDLGLVAPTQNYLRFGLKWLDADNDGWLDLLMTCGHVQDNISAIDRDATYRQPSLFFQNEQGEHFSDKSSTVLAGPAGRPIVGRGLAIGDYDNDGRIDALVVDSEGAPLLLHNETPRPGHWLEVKLIGAHSNRDGQGALVSVTAGGRTLQRQCTTNGSYLSASDKRVHFGLGSATVVQRVVVRWSGGRVDTREGVRGDQCLTLREGASSE